MCKDWRVIGLLRRCMLGDCAGSRSVGRPRNGWVGDRIKVHITGGFGVPEEDGNGRRVID